MDVVTLDGKEYVKVAKVARELGYTRDYIGQLCRAKKIDAQLVGRSWYVNLDSLKAHKKGRYQNSPTHNPHLQVESCTPVATQVSIATPREVHQETSTQAAVSNSRVRQQVSEYTAKINKEEREKNNYESRLKRLGSPTYYNDETDLIPTRLVVEAEEYPTMVTLEKPVELSVHEAPENKEDYMLEPVVEFKPTSGSLSVVDLAARRKVVVAKNRKTTQKTAIKVHRNEIKPKNRVISDKGDKAKTIKNSAASQASKLKAAPVVGPRPETEFPELIQSPTTKGNSRLVTASSEDQVGIGNRLLLPASQSLIKSSLSPLALSVVAGFVLFMLAIGLSWEFNFTNSDSESGYTFNVSSVIGSQ